MCIMLAENKEFCYKKQLKLQSGKSLSEFKLSYSTFGILNPEKDNAILICHALTGSSNVTSESDKEPGWWQHMVGPDKPVDTNKYFVICSNVLGSCKGSTGPTSINPETKTPYELDFPIVTVQDWVNAQKLLIDELSITYLAGVVGPSMGGMQALSWAITYPDLVKKCVVIGSSYSLSPQALAFGTVCRNAVVSDEHFNGGAYKQKKPKKGLSIARMIGHITYLSKTSITEKFGRKLQNDIDYNYKHNLDFQVESYLQYQGDKFVDQFDANAYIYLSKALSYFDLEKEYGSLQHAFQPIKANMLFISISSDWLYPTEQSKKMVRACMNLNKRVSFCEVQSEYGHDAFLIECEKFGKPIKSFLEFSV